MRNFLLTIQDFLNGLELSAMFFIVCLWGCLMVSATFFIENYKTIHFQELEMNNKIAITCSVNHNEDRTIETSHCEIMNPYHK